MSDNKIRSWKRWILPVAVIAVILALLGVCIWFFFFHEKEEPTEQSDKDKKIRLTVDYFTFRQTAFRCGDGETPVLVIAEFYDTKEDLSNLVLYAYCEETGEEIMMTDDGKGADTIAGDHAFYGRTSFSFEEETTLTFSLTCKRSKYKLSAPKTTVFSYTDETYDRCMALTDEINRHLDEMAEGINQNLKTEEDAQAYAEVVGQMTEYLQSLQDDGQIRSFSYDFPYFIIHLPVTSFAYSFGYVEDLMGGTGNDASGGSVRESLFEDEAREIAMFLPFDGDLDSASTIEAVNSVASANLGYKLTKTYKKNDMSIDSMKHLQPYRVIVINSHGAYTASLGPLVSINVPTDNIPSEDRVYTIPAKGGGALLTFSFFEHYYEDGSLNNCLIYLGLCHGADDERLQRVLLRKGARAVFAYTNSVYTAYGDSMVKTILKAMATEDPKNPDKTISASVALETAKLLHGDKDPTNRDLLAYLINIFNHDVFNHNPAELMLYQSNDSVPFRLSDDIDGGTIYGSVISAADNQPLFLAKIQLEKDGSSFSTYTSADGTFSYSLPEGTYKVTVTSDGFHPLIYTCKVLRNHKTYLETMLLLEHGDGDYGLAQGIVTSALTGEALPGVQLTMRKDWNNLTEGEVIARLKTDEHGQFKIDLPTGYYTVLAEKEGYVTSSFNIVAGPNVNTYQTYSLNKALADNEYRIVLTWAVNPEDLDLHLAGPRASGNTFHVFYKNLEYWEDGQTICMLDVDDTSSYGPETVTVLVLTENQPYYCYVHHYQGSGSLTTSSARLDVYRGSEMLGTFFVPATNDSGIYWNAFAIKNGKIIPKNTITNEPDLKYAGE